MAEGEKLGDLVGVTEGERDGLTVGMLMDKWGGEKERERKKEK